MINVPQVREPVLQEAERKFAAEFVSAAAKYF